MAVIEQSYAHRLADAMQATGADDETIVSWWVAVPTATP